MVITLKQMINEMKLTEKWEEIRKMNPIDLHSFKQSWTCPLTNSRRTELNNYIHLHYSHDVCNEYYWNHVPNSHKSRIVSFLLGGR